MCFVFRCGIVSCCSLSNPKFRPVDFRVICFSRSDSPPLFGPPSGVLEMGPPRESLSLTERLRSRRGRRSCTVFGAIGAIGDFGLLELLVRNLRGRGGRGDWAGVKRGKSLLPDIISESCYSWPGGGRAVFQEVGRLQSYGACASPRGGC